jgi:hypothetical protein
MRWSAIFLTAGTLLLVTNLRRRAPAAATSPRRTGHHRADRLID